MDKELKKELEQRGTAEVSNGVVTQVTQALEETETKARVLLFGEMREFTVKPIGECCEVCDLWKKYSKSIQDCQSKQKVDAAARGFNLVICANQLN